MTLFLSYLINGINLGSIYAIIALGYTMVYGIARMLNFAHGDVIMIGAYICFIAVSSMGLSPLLGVLLAMVVCTVLGMTIERLAYRPLRQAASLAVLITAIGISYLLQNVAQLIWTANPKSFPMLVETLIENAAVALGLTTPEKIAMTPNFGDIVIAENLRISGTTIVTILANILIMVGLTLFTGHTKRGKAMRAVSEDRGAAELMGISVGGHCRRAALLDLSHAAAHHRLHARHQGLHRGGVRRHRLHPRGDARRHSAGRDRDPWPRLCLHGAGRRLRLRRADRSAAGQAHGPFGQEGQRESVR